MKYAMELVQAIQRLADSVERIADSLGEPDYATRTAAAQIEDLLADPNYTTPYDRHKLEIFVERHNE